MNANEIQLSRKITNQLLHAAQISPNQEVCGLIGGKEGVASSCYAIINIAEQPETRFLLDEKQHIAAMSAMREKNESLFAIYHSHPTAPAVPSARDIQMASYPEAIHLIISLNTKGVLEIRAFSIAGETVEEKTLRLTS